jgi:hypothetical protein
MIESIRAGAIVALFGGALLLPACNFITGADVLEIDRVGGSAAQRPQNLAAGVQISRIVLSQGPSQSIMDAGSAVAQQLPIVAGRPALLRIFYRADAGHVGDQVAVRVTVDGAHSDKFFKLDVAQSSESQLASTLNVTLGADIFSPGDNSISVDVLGISAVDKKNQSARFPAGGANHALRVSDVGDGLRLTVFTLRHSTKTGVRVAVVPPGLEETLERLYPIGRVAVSAGQVFEWAGPLAPTEEAYLALLESMRALRAKVKPPPNEYWLALITPAETRAAYCAGFAPCVTGLGYVTSQGAPSAQRVAVSASFGDSASADVAAHELGHTLGLRHAPCGDGSGVDGKAVLGGTWGYDIKRGRLVDPSATHDFMGYCDPTWISPYHFIRLVERLEHDRSL